MGFHGWLGFLYVAGVILIFDSLICLLMDLLLCCCFVSFSIE